MAQRSQITFRKGAQLGLLAALVVFAPGCGGLFYAIEAGSASSKLEQAKQLDAEHRSPYHYFSAQEYLKKASEEAASADYSDAIDMAEEAAKHADEAIKDSRSVMKESGR